MSAALLQPCDTEAADTTRDAKGRFTSQDPWVRIRQSEVAAMNDDLADADAGIAHLSSENTRLEGEVATWMGNNRECLAALSAAQSEVKRLKIDLHVSKGDLARANADIDRYQGMIYAAGSKRTMEVNSLRAEVLQLRDSIASAKSDKWEWIALGAGGASLLILVASYAMWCGGLRG